MLKDMLVKQIILEKGCALGLCFQMQAYPLLVLRAEKGFLMCGYLDTRAAERLVDAAAKVTGVKTFEDMLKAKIVEATPAARALGVEPGMTGEEALNKMF